MDPQAPRANWLRRQIDEIAADPILRFYGVALAVQNVVTVAYWTLRRDLAVRIGEGSFPMCWPFWEDCHLWRVLTREQVSAILGIYLILSMAAGVAFLFRRRVAWGYGLLLAVYLLRMALVAQDFTLRLNQHYMAIWVGAAFLLWPRKRALIPALLVSFYFWAGALKLDTEWLTGAALYNSDKLWMPAALVPASCVYVVVLEMLLVFGLYSRRAWLWGATLAQLVVFHVWSWPIVGFYYPLLMFALLSIFPMIRLTAPAGQQLSAADLCRPGTRLPALTLLGGFALCQLLPFAFPGDSAITGQGRLFALNMFDALVVCEGTTTEHRTDGTARTTRVPNKTYAKRIACDPIFHFNYARHQCRRLAARGKGGDIDLKLRSRRTSEPELRDVIDIRGFCSTPITYDMWRANTWILP
ncbi:MAG: hypothetical protein ABR538_04495 [Candidatus Binatia bacterium]